MTSSSSASSTTSTVSSSKSPTKVSPSLSQYNFDPFAVHPFTNYTSANPNGDTPTVNYSRNSPSHAYPYRQPFGDYPAPYTPTPSPLATIPIVPPHQPLQPSPTKPYTHTPPRPKGVFVPFRQETSSPELSDVLKPKSSSPSIGHSSSRKH